MTTAIARLRYACCGATAPNSIVQMWWYDDETAFYMTTQDKSGHHKTETELENARLLMEAIVQTVREPLIVLDDGLRIRMVNRAFCNTFRVTETETVNHLIDDMGDGQWQIPRLRILLNEVISQNTSFEDFEFEYKFPVIGLKKMLLNARQIEISGQASRLILLAIEDVTARRQIEADLAEKAKELARSNAELEQFAYVASHDLQEPLRMVASYVQLLARRYQGKLDQDADDFIGFAVDGATRMQMLINHLLAYSRVGRKGNPFEPVDCERVLAFALADMQPTIAKEQASITSDPLPTVMGDMGQLVQVFENLIGNGIKFHGDAPPRIHIGTQRDGDDWRFSVRDYGIGIEPQYWDRIFLIFERLHDRESYPGTGIGLAITKKIIERHGGHIWIESEPGNGSDFQFTLPTIKEET